MRERKPLLRGTHQRYKKRNPERLALADKWLSVLEEAVKTPALQEPSTSYIKLMEKHFPNHWPIESFNWWVGYWFTFGRSPSYEEWRLYVKSKQVSKGDTHSMQAAHDVEVN